MNPQSVPLSPASRRRGYSRFALPYLAICVAIVGVTNTASAQIVFQSGMSGGAFTAWGDFTAPANWQVCSVLDTSIIPGGTSSIEVVGGSVRFTSPEDNVPNQDDLTWSINTCNGVVGAALTGGQINLGNEPPDFPGTNAYSFNLAGSSAVGWSPGTGLCLCARTRNPEYHIAGYLRNGYMVYFSQNDAPFNTHTNVDLGYVVEASVGGGGVDCANQWLEQVGHGFGAGNSVFETLIAVFNGPGGDDVFMDLINTERGSDQVRTEMSEFPLGRIDIQEFSMTHGTEIFGSERFDCIDANLKAGRRSPNPMIQAVIFATLPDGSQYGQYFQAKLGDWALQSGQSGLLFTTHDPTRYRVNVGVTAVTNGTRVVLTPRGDGGVALADPVAVEFDRGENTQFSNINTRWGLGNTADVMVEATVESGAALVYSSILDGRGSTPGTSDPTTIMPVTEGADRVVLLEVGRITGLDEFSGSASVYNHSTANNIVNVAFFERGVPGVSNTASFTLGPKETISWDDAVGELVDRSGVVGALVFTVGAGSGISAVGREFAIYQDGGVINGTAGQAMPGLLDSDMLQPGSTFHFIALRDRQLADGPERSHLGLLNLGETDVTVAVKGIADDGSAEGEIERTVRAGEQLRINRVLRAINPNQDGGVKRIEVTSTGPIHALAYLVNSTGDPVTLLPFRR